MISNKRTPEKQGNDIMKILFIAVFAFIISTVSIAQWGRTNGPDGISINSLASIHNVLYAGTRTDGVYASTDEGSTWFALNNGIETEEITAITSINDTLLIGTYDYGVYHSIDGGQTWLSSSNYSGVNVAAMVVNDQYVFAGTSQGLFRSSDGGVNWEDISFLSYYESVTAICTTGNKLIATDFSDTYASTDNGENWYVIQSVGSEIFSLYAKGDTVFAGSRNKIYRSVDGGDTFIEIEIPFDYSLVNVNCITYVGQTLFIGTTYDNGVYKSTDNGAFWESASEGMGPKDIRALAVTQSSNLIAGSYYSGVYRSTNIGENWNKSVSGFPAGSSILSIFNSGRNLLAGTRDGLYRTTDNGASWDKLTGESDTINYGDVRGIAVRGSEIYAAITYKFHGIVYKSTNFGDTWTRSGNGFASDITFMSGIAVSGNNIVAGSDQGIYYSTDDGSSWVLSNLNSGYAEEIAATANYLYAEVPYHGVYRSSDNGITWSPSLISPDLSLTSITAQDNYVYTGLFQGHSFYSTDNGNNWYQIGFPPTGYSVYTIKYIPAVPGMIIAGTSIEPNYIYASFNYSNVFSPYSEGLGVNAITEALASNNLYSFAGTDFNGIWRRLLPGVTPVEITLFTATADYNNVTLNWQTATETNNKGFEIERQVSSPQSEVSPKADRQSSVSNSEWKKIGFQIGNGTSTKENHYSYIDRNLEAGNYSYRLVQIDFDGTRNESKVVNAEVGSLPSSYSLSQNYPNPFNPATAISYSLPKNTFVKLIVYNSIGEEIRTLVNRNEEAGRYNVNFNAGELVSGIYFYRLETPEFNSVKKMIVLK